jgi:hypothetical protein
MWIPALTQVKEMADFHSASENNAILQFFDLSQFMAAAFVRHLVHERKTNH